MQPIDPKIFDDPQEMAMNAIDLDVADAAHSILDRGIDPSDRAAVEHALTGPGCYRAPETFRLFIDAVISAAHYQREHADDVSPF